jgi:hypothetical protein
MGRGLSAAALFFRGLFVKQIAAGITPYATRCFPSHDRPSQLVHGDAVYETACFKGFRAHL